MSQHCQIPNCIEKIFSASHCSVAYIGGSITVGVGASNVAKTSWRALFTEYLYQQYHRKYHCQVSEVMGAVGASESYVSVFTLPRNVIPAKPDLAFVEFAVNDRGAPDKDLVLKGMEGIVRQLLGGKSRCNVVILGAGSRDGKIDHALHRQVAEHYDIPFIDAQDFIFRKLAERGQAWDAAALDFEINDPWHLNDYGNRLFFEAMRECFEEQVRRFEAGHRKERAAPLPPPLVSDELAHVELVDPTRKNQVTLSDGWTVKHKGHVPWYFDNLLVGQPGAKLSFTFTGTAVAVFGLMYNNGLKLEALLDGEELAGPYLRHFIEFGKGMVLAHGLPHGEHRLELTVGETSERHHKLDNPTAQVGYIGIARPPAADGQAAPAAG